MEPDRLTEAVHVLYAEWVALKNEVVIARENDRSDLAQLLELQTVFETLTTSRKALSQHVHDHGCW